MKHLLIISFLFFTLHVSATTYYVSSSGSDANNGTSTGTPWLTLAKVNATTFSPGDNILFKSGEVFSGSLTVSQSGTAGNPITFGKYSTGVDPLITGYTLTSSWVSQGGGVYSYTNAAMSSTMLRLVLFGVAIQPMGRVPTSGYNMMTGHSGTTSITDAGLANSPSYIGGQVVIRSSHYTLDACTVTGQSSGVVTYTSGTTAPTGNNGYFFQNCAACLAALGDWYYKPSTTTLYMYFGGNVPSSYIIKASTNDVLFQCGTNSYITINGIDFEGANQYTFQGHSANNVIFEKCTINGSGVDAIHATSYANCVFDNNTINDSNSNAITLVTVNNTNVTNNTINRAGMIPGAGENFLGVTGYGSYDGIAIGPNAKASSYNNLIQYNTVNNTGYCGIEIDGDSYTIDKNYVNGACQVKDDGGGIYTWVGSTAIVYSNRTISNNIVTNTIGASAGMADGLNQGNSIYADDNSSNLTLDHNYINTSNNDGFYLHNAHEITFTNNEVYNATGYALRIVGDGISVPLNFTITGNKLVSNATTQFTIFLRSSGTGSSSGDITRFGTCNNNYFGAVNGGTNLFAYQDGGGSYTTTNFAGWKTATTKDGSSVFNAITPLAKQFSYNATKSNSNVSLTGIWEDITLTHNSGTITLTPYTAKTLFQISAGSVPIAMHGVPQLLH
jgi:hypothetical protein